MKVVIYARSATTKANDKNYSVDHQLAMLRDYCKKENHEVVGVYCDIGKGGLDFERPGWKLFMKDLESNQIHAELLICTSSDRFCRSGFTAITILQKLQMAGIQMDFISKSLKKIPNKRNRSSKTTIPCKQLTIPE